MSDFLPRDTPDRSWPPLSRHPYLAALEVLVLELVRQAEADAPARFDALRVHPIESADAAFVAEVNHVLALLLARSRRPDHRP